MISLMITSSMTYAQTSSTGAMPDGTSTVQINPEVKEEDKSFSADIAIEMSQKITAEERTERENTTSITLAPSYKINSLLTAAVKTVFNQDNYGQRESNLSNTTVSLGIKGYQISQDFKTKHSISSVVPTNEKTINDDRLKGNIGVSNGIAFSNDYISASYALGLSRNFHEFSQNRAGSPNIEYRVSHIVEVRLPVTEQLALSGSGVYRVGYTYNDFERYSFIFDADISYEFIKSLTANIGTSNDGAALKANGVDSNIAAYNENTSVYRAGLTYSY